ncbi:hypothetical protein, partial [Nocardioides sp.]|uniref:hypothetical protein n=1 Tax=Nocardioides sp. TaxID=35761 RepID=UPI002B26C692
MRPASTAAAGLLALTLTACSGPAVEESPTAPTEQSATAPSTTEAQGAPESSPAAQPDLLSRTIADGVRRPRTAAQAARAVEAAEAAIRRP